MSVSVSKDVNTKTFYPGLLALGIVLLLVVAGAALREKPPATQPLKPARQIIILLVPGLSFSDARNTVARGDGASVAVFPNRLPWRTGTTKLTTLNPATQADFVRACDQLGGEKLQSAFRVAGIHSVSPGENPAAHAFLGDTTGGDGANSGLEWRSNNPKAVDGFVTDPARLAQSVRRELGKPSGAPRLVAATFDDLLRVDAYAPLTRPDSTNTQRHAALRRLDTLFAQFTGSGPNALPLDTALLLIAPVPSMEAAERGELLGPMLLWQRPAAPDVAGSLLTSPSTRQTPGLLAPGDIAATVIQLSGVSENRTGGRSAVVLETASTPGPDADALAAQVAYWSAQAREIHFLVTLPWLLAGTFLAAAFFRQGNVRSACVLGACAAPLALILAAPFASQKPGDEALVYAVAGLIVLVAALLSAFIRRGKNGLRTISFLRVLFLATGGVIVFGTLTGGTLLARSPLSYSPVFAARFYGIGNEISGVFLGASLLAVGVLCPTPLGAALGGLIVCLVSGLSMFGADAGGFVSALIAFGVLFVLLSAAGSENRRRTLFRAGTGAGIVVLLLFALYVVGNGRLSVGARTHVGEAVTSAQNQGAARALLPLIRRKAATGLRLLFSSPWSILLITETGICLWLWRRRKSDSVYDSVYGAAFAAGTALLIVNDSGVVAAATCLLYPVSSLLFASSPSPSSTDEMRTADS